MVRLKLVGGHRMARSSSSTLEHSQGLPIEMNAVDEGMARFGESALSGDRVFRGEPFGVEHLEAHARELAAAILKTPSGKASSRFRERLNENAKLLRHARETLAGDGETQPPRSEGEWLLDNFHVVEEQLREIVDDLPPGFYRKLPKSPSGAPRIYALAVEYLTHTDSVVQEDSLVRYIQAFQELVPLSIGETWALPTMFRLGLVENLRRIAGGILEDRRARQQAEDLVNAWRSTGDFSFDCSSKETAAPIVQQILERLHTLGTGEAVARQALERRLGQFHLVVDDVLHFEHCREAATQVSIGNVITSMRLISSLDWVDFFERTNIAENVLRQDPAGIYREMDFATRDRYRHEIERLARRWGRPDNDVARQVLERATAATQERQRHVGYYLIAEGRAPLESLAGRRSPFGFDLREWILRHPGMSFFGSAGAVTLILVGVLIGVLRGAGATWTATLLMSLACLLPALDLALQFANLVHTMLVPPRLPPRLDFSRGIPSRWSTVVVVPAMLTGRREIDSLVERLELHALANPDPALRFVLLVDFRDASQQSLPGDADLLNYARERMDSLNQRYGEEGARLFFLLHRNRRWNPSENAWMGWERKRGKLLEFNRLLRGAIDTTYAESSDRTELVRASAGAVFAITLDADTQLPHGAAHRLAGTLAHPLNRPQYDAAKGRITSGYALLQPRLITDLGSANRSRYSRYFSNSPGVDPYAASASDVYQDLFGEGSFTGKGIYDIDAIEAALEGAFPENAILSHDLIEGCYARAALVSNVDLVDGSPASYFADAHRLHRWVRGDWQLLPWLLPGFRGGRGRAGKTLSGLSHWKIADNLRRSLTAPALMVALVSGWLWVPSLAWGWTLFGLAVIGFPLIVQALWFLSGRFALPLHRAGEFPGEIERSAVECVTAAAVLPHKAGLMVDAIVRTLYRLLGSRRHLLEWETAAASERRLSQGPRREYAVLVSIAILAGLLAVILPPQPALAAAPFLVAWLAAPWLVAWLNRQFQPLPGVLEDTERRALRRLARRTWGFFEHVVGSDDNWLPIDNLQEYPAERRAHRISPTNEGLFLVSALVARDFGFISLSDLIELVTQNLDAWSRLDRLHGHYFNWYDTQRLEPLKPRYLSTVDSGNLMASFLTVAQGLRELQARPLFDCRIWDGLQDAVDVAEETCQLLQPRGARLVSPPLDTLIAALQQLRVRVPRRALDWSAGTAQFAEAVARVEDALTALRGNARSSETDVVPVFERLLAQCRGLLTEWTVHFGWLSLLPAAAGDASADDGRGWIGDRWFGAIADPGSPRSLSGIEVVEPVLAELRQRNVAPHAIAAIEAAARSSTAAAGGLCDRLADLAHRMEKLAREMDFSVLYSPDLRLFSIGYNVEECRLDRAHYDLLCSEARLASYLAIAKGDVEYRHWFRLGRPTARIAGSAALLSWGGTMFEYLMPALFQKVEPGSILERSCRAAVARQIEYGRQQSVPWGISESAFGALASNTDYHYQSFGVPGTGLKRGLGKDLVVSPYSTLLALEWDIVAAARNLHALRRERASSSWGFYDAIDFTPDRVPAGRRSIVVQCYMSHHQGMGLIALGNLLLDGNTRRRFHSHPLGRSCELLLQERSPAQLVGTPVPEEEIAAEISAPSHEMVRRRIVGIDQGLPRTHLVSNGRYCVLLSHAGGGYSTCGEVVVSRWRSDATCDDWGQFIYLRNRRTDRIWSAGFQPTRARPDLYESLFSIDKAEIVRRDGDIESHLEITVSPENNAEIRQLRLINHGPRLAEIEVTSFAEVVLNPQAADLAHPAFQNLFVQTEFVPAESALLAWRRPREGGPPTAWAVHVLSARQAADVQFETSRVAFVGRRRSVHAPVALRLDRLEGRAGTVLDPIFSLRCRVAVPPGESATVAFTTAFASSREEALALADQYHHPQGAARAFELAWAYRQVELRHLQISPAQSHLFQRLATPLLYNDRRWRAAPESLMANRQGQSALWRYGISGDLPIVLARIDKPEQASRAEELLLAHEFWRRNGLDADLVLLNDFPGSYFDAVQEHLASLIGNRKHSIEDRPGKVFLLRGSQIPQDDQVLLESAAAVVWSCERGTISQQIDALERQAPESDAGPPQELMRRSAKVDGPKVEAGPPAPGAGKPRQRTQPLWRESEPLLAWNGFGGFRDQGREYRIEPEPGRVSGAPWSNVIAGPAFGCLVTESGGGYTWAGNSREYKLTSWSNDPVCDPPSEILFVRDAATGDVFTPMIPPADRDPSRSFRVDHGIGYSRFEAVRDGLHAEVLVGLTDDAPVKCMQLKLTNASDVPRECAIACYVEWVLGVTRQQTQSQIRTSLDDAAGCLMANNPFHAEMPERVAFLGCTAAEKSFTGDRTEFVGRYGDRLEPVALHQQSLSGRVGAGLDPCGAVMTRVKLEPGGSREIQFLLGSAESVDQARLVLSRFRTGESLQAALVAGIERWKRDLGVIQVRTPVPAIDVLANGWLLYQALSSRVWGRTAFYQCGGAYGFRDQLQDGLALVYARPDLVRQHLLLAASRQFEEGDVQHWWHPPLGRGTRTRYSDDLFWLPFAACHYVNVTGDHAVWDEEAPFLRSPILNPAEHERYELPATSPVKDSLYEHCRRAIAYGFRTGTHGLPLMGGGDWNDGMNKVGAGGQGESVWLGWFLLVVLEDFLPVMRLRTPDEARHLETRAGELRRSLEQAWDGAWYVRAYFDDGKPLGSHTNDECQIDSIAQSWAMFARADPNRVSRALQSAWERLYRPENGLVLLFEPPFDRSAAEPGYVKAYPPGVRENGGQYTHAAIWLARAFALAGDAARAMKLLRAINPVDATSTPERVGRYQAEPFVVAADVSASAENPGRGGWTWYTGSAAWMYRLIVEDLLGFRLRGTTLRIAPCVPADWDQFELVYRRNGTQLNVLVVVDSRAESPSVACTLDGSPCGADGVELPQDGREHQLIVRCRPAGQNTVTGTAPAEAVDRTATVNGHRPGGKVPEVLQGGLLRE